MLCPVSPHVPCVFSRELSVGIPERFPEDKQRSFHKILVKFPQELKKKIEYLPEHFPKNFRIISREVLRKIPFIIFG